MVFLGHCTVFLADSDPNDCAHTAVRETSEYLFCPFGPAGHVDKDLPGFPLLGAEDYLRSRALHLSCSVFGYVPKHVKHIGDEKGFFLIKKPLQMSCNHVIGGGSGAEKKGDSRYPLTHR